MTFTHRIDHQLPSGKILTTPYEVIADNERKSA